MIKEYMKYLKNNPEGYWFKAKCFGWGWTPVTWQGWAITIGYIALIVLFSLTIDEQSPRNEIAFTFALPVVFLTLIFIRIAYKKGEKPHWRWGCPNEKDKDEK